MITPITLATAVSNGMAIFKPLYMLFGKCMEGLLYLFNDKYFLSLIVFTILTRLILFPFTLKQQKATAKTARLQPKIQKIQKKYANMTDPKDRQRQQEEMQALYEREGHNPMNMGCGPMLFQMVFLMGIIGIIYYPIQYILGIDISSQSNEIAEALGINGSYFQIEILQNFDAYRETLATQFGDLFTPEKLDAIAEYRTHMFLGNVDMTKIPSIKDWSDPVICIPIFCLITSMGSSVLSTMIQKKQNPAAAAQGNQMLLMMLMMPFFSFYISFKVSAAVGFYWIISNVIALVQQLVMATFFPPKRNIARQMIESTIERRSRENSIKNTK